MPKEIELKLRLPADSLDIFAEHPALAGITPAQKRLHNIYFDTPDLQLRQHGVALRFRQSGRQWLLTVKGGNPGAGGLAQRNEWETPRRRGNFDFSHVTDSELRDYLEARKDAFIPLFTTDFVRTTWLIPATSGGGIEVARDHGLVSAGDASEPISEIELERIDAGDSGPLFALAMYLSDRLPLHPEARSKAERGYALYGALQSMPRKTAYTPVKADMSPLEAFQAVAFDCLDQLTRNEAGALVGDDPEYVHQARVGIRRLRSSFSLFAPALPKDFPKTYGAPWREVANALGGGRDWDVLMCETLPRFAAQAKHYKPPKSMSKAAAKAHDRSLQTTREALTHPGYSRLLLLFSADVHALGVVRVPTATGTLHNFARQRLAWQYKRVWAIVKTTRLKNHLHRHDLRIALKKLRYAMDFFTPVLRANELAKFRRRVARLQNVLGHLNDIVVGRQLLAELKHRKGPDPLDNWLAAEHGRLVGGLAGALKQLRKAKAPW